MAKNLSELTTSSISEKARNHMPEHDLVPDCIGLAPNDLCDSIRRSLDHSKNKSGRGLS